MEFGGIFILLVVLVVVGILGGGVYAAAMWLRHKQLDPEKDKTEGERENPPRPEHVEVDNEQRARFVGTR
jgi:flagellar basal body-associated protein FliL